jgi:hypothetical protein
VKKEEERFHPAKCAGWCRGLSAQADAFAGANAEEKASACSVRNDGGGKGARRGGRPEGRRYERQLRGEGEDAEGAAGAVDDFEGGSDDDGASGGKLIEIAEAGEAELAVAVHDAMIGEGRVKLGGLACVGAYRFDAYSEDVAIIR